MSEVCEECGYELDNEVCPNCGLIAEDRREIDSYFPYRDKEERKQHGPLRSNRIVDMSVMTYANPKETKNPDLRRALNWDGYFGWDVQSSMILNGNIRKIVTALDLGDIFMDKCFYWIRKIRNTNLKFSGISLEETALALVYLFARIEGKTLFLFNFKRLNCDPNSIYKLYRTIVKKLDYLEKIKPQDLGELIKQIVNSMISHKDFRTYRYKTVLINEVTKDFSSYWKKFYPNNFVDVWSFEGGKGAAAIGALIYMRLKSYKDKDVVMKNVTQKTICSFCGCSEVTLRKYIDLIKKHLRRKDKL